MAQAPVRALASVQGSRSVEAWTAPELAPASALELAAAAALELAPASAREQESAQVLARGAAAAG
jgi:hypothetical protein